MTEETIFTAALDKRTLAERSAFLHEACGQDAALRQRVEVLIAAHEQAADFLEKPAFEQMAANGPASKGRTDAVHGIRPAVEGIAATPSDACFGETQAESPRDDADGLSLDFLAPSEKPDALGRIDHYHVLAVIGRGGMGAVLKAFDDKLQRVVAIKVMASQVAITGTARKRFRREAAAAAAVRDEHVIDIHAVDEVNGLPYLVMEYISGISLQDRIDRSGPLELKEILRIGLQTATGLAKAHAQGLIHRDIKPANILLENGVQRVKITDFGLARAVDDASLTQSGVIAGTPQYMAPEQARGEAVDPRADLFSLGSVLYAMCTGHPPFRANSTMAVLKRVCDDTPRPIREMNPEIPDWLAAIIDKLHAKDPAQRFPSAQDVADLLGQHLLHLQQPGIIPLPPPVMPPILPQSRKWSWVWVWLLATVFLACLGACINLGIPVLKTYGSRVWPTYVATVRVVETVEAPRVQGAPVPAVLPRAALAGHTRAASAVAFSPDGKTLATADRGNGTIYLWDAATHQKLADFPAHGNAIWSLAYSPDGKRLASASWDRTAKVWDAATHQLQITLQGHTDRLWWVSFAPDGKTLTTASEDKTVRLWDAATGEEQRKLEHDAPVYCAIFRPDAKLLATSTASGWIRLWDTATWQRPISLDGHIQGVGIRLVFSPDGKTLASGSQDQTVGLWDVSTGEKVATLRGFREMIESVAFSPDGKLLATGGGNWRNESLPGEVTLWEVAGRKQVARLEGNPSCVIMVAFSPDGQTVAAANNDRTVKLWDVPRPAVAHAFVILARDGKAERPFATLQEAIAAARNGDTLEVRGDGPFASEPILLANKALTIRAGEGFRPVLNLQPKDGKIADPLLETYAPLVLEGLALQRLEPWQGREGHPERNALLLLWKAPLHAVNCRFLMKTRGVGIWTLESSVCNLHNCAFGGPDMHAAVDWTSPPGGLLSLQNCLLLAGPHGLVIHQKWTDAKGCSVQLTHNTLSANLPLDYWLWAPVQKVLAGATDKTPRSLRIVPVLPSIEMRIPVGAADKASRSVHIEAEANLFDAPGHVLDFKQIDQPMPLPAGEAEPALPRIVSWREQQNVYPARPGQFLLLSSLNCGNVLRTPVSPPRVATLADWRRYWGMEKSASDCGKLKYQGGDVRARAKNNPEAIIPSDFRLQVGSAGKGTGEDGRDLGADVDLVGPGAAYERWKQTPGYQQWLKNTKQAQGGKP